MTTPAPEPKPKRSRRMVLWMVAMPIAILLLALAGANWKTFHLAYAKHLMRSEDPAKQGRGVWMVVETHLRKGMPLEEVRRLLTPATVTEIFYLFRRDRRFYEVAVAKAPSDEFFLLIFDENDRLIRP